MWLGKIVAKSVLHIYFGGKDCCWKWGGCRVSHYKHQLHHCDRKKQPMKKMWIISKLWGLVIHTLRVEIQMGFLAFWSGSHRACVLVILYRSSNVSSILHFCLLLYLPAGRTHKYTRDILIMNIMFLSLCLPLSSLIINPRSFKQLWFIHTGG